MSEIQTAASHSVRSVSRALHLLGVLGPDRPQATLTEFCAATDLPTSTVQRLLHTLENENFLRREPDGRYTFGTALLQLGLASLQNMEVYDLAKPILENLSHQTGETANLAILNDSGKAVYIRQAISQKSIKHANWMGRPFALKSTAVGAVLTGKAGKYGYYWTRKTQEPEVTAVAAPVHNADQNIIAGISVTGPSYRMPDKEIDRIAACVVDAAIGLSSLLGGQWSYESLSSKK